HILAVLIIVVVSRSALAQGDPTSGPDRFPQFRNLSGLAGSGYGVGVDGHPSLSGPTALSTPVAHVLGPYHYQVSGAKMSFTSSPEITESKSNGTVAATLGLSYIKFNFAASIMFLSDIGDNAINLQAQYVPSSSSKLVGSIGIQDLDGGGG